MAKVLQINWLARHTEKRESESAPLQGVLRVAVESEADIPAALATVELPDGFAIQANGYHTLLDNVTVIAPQAGPAKRTPAKKKRAKK